MSAVNCYEYDCCVGAYDSYSVEPLTGDYELIIKLDPEDGGTVEGAGLFEAFSEVTATATPEIDFAFVGWYDAFNNLLSEEEEYTFVLTGNLIITARFTAI